MRGGLTIPLGGGVATCAPCLRSSVFGGTVTKWVGSDLRGVDLGVWFRSLCEDNFSTARFQKHRSLERDWFPGHGVSEVGLVGEVRGFFLAGVGRIRL